MDERAAAFRREAADRYGLSIEVEQFPEGTETAAEAADVVGCTLAQIASSLVFVADGTPVVVVTSGANRVDEGRLAAFLDATDVRMASTGEVTEATGYSVGGVPRPRDGVGRRRHTRDTLSRCPRPPRRGRQRHACGGDWLTL